MQAHKCDVNLRRIFITTPCIKVDREMDRYQETFETWNKVATLYEDKFMDLDIYNDTYDFICDAITKPNAKILEIGCGPGNITRYILAQRPDFNVFGIDIAENMIELAKINNPKANFSVMDTREISSIEQKFDGIVGGFCLPYLSQPDCEKLIYDANNLLNESGLIYLSFVEGESSKSNFQIGSDGSRVYFYYHNLDKLKEQLENHSFEVLKTFKLEYEKPDTELQIHTIITARKISTL